MPAPNFTPFAANSTASVGELVPAASLCEGGASRLEGFCNDFYKSTHAQQERLEMTKVPAKQDSAMPSVQCSSSAIPAQVFCCSECYKEFSANDESGYNFHLESKQCHQCRLIFKCNGLVIQHWFESNCGLASNTTHAKCPDCHGRFNNVKEYYLHIRTRRCRHCFTDLSCYTSILKHMQSYKCQVCHQNFPCMGKAIEHDRQLVSCKSCLEKFHSLKGESEHRDVNKCPTCQHHVGCLTMLIQHTCEHLVSPPPPPAPPPPWQCQHCFVIFEAHVSQKGHLKYTQCKCGVKFKCQYELEYHSLQSNCNISVKETEKRVPQSVAEAYAALTCSTCKVTFGSIASLSTHQSHLKDGCLQVKTLRSPCLHCPLVFASNEVKVQHAKLKFCKQCKFQYGCPMALESHECLERDSSSDDNPSAELQAEEARSVEEPCETKHPVEEEKKLTLVELMYSQMKSEMCADGDDEQKYETCTSDLVKVEFVDEVCLTIDEVKSE